MNDIGKVDVGKVCQNDLVFGMNAVSRKVFRECLVGIIITEPKRKRGAELEDEEAPERRGFRAGVDLRLGAIDTTNISRKREGEKKKIIRKAPKQFKYSKYTEIEYVCMGNA